MARDADLTQRRILQAALEEFSEKGLAGARVDAIAERAGTSVRMLYHYFGNKDELFDEVLRQHVGLRWQGLGTPLPLDELIVEHFSQLAQDHEFVRLVQWESLTPRRPPTEASLRRQRYQALVDHLREEQVAGRLDVDLDPDLVIMLVVALASFPIAFPGLTAMISGDDPANSPFEGRYRSFLAEIGRRLAPPGATSDGATGDNGTAAAEAEPQAT